MLTKFQVAYKNLLRKRIRSLLTLVGIALSSWVLVSLLGFNNGYETALNKDIDNLGYELMIMAKGCPYEAATLMLKGGTGLRYMQESVMEEIAKEPEVDKIMPMLMSAVFDPNKGESGGIAGYFGVEAKSFAAIKPFLKFRQGEWFKDDNAYEAVMGFEAAELEQREVGDMILMPEKNVQFKVVGILERTGTQDDGTIFVPLRTLQKIFNRPDELTTIGIKLKKGADSARLEEKLYKLPDVQIVSLAQVKGTIMTLISTAKIMVLSIAIIAILIAMVGVINTILTSVWERFQEIGILKTIGAMPWDIFKLIWIETVILCTTGGVLGIILALILALRPGRGSGPHRPETSPGHAGRDSVHRPSQRYLSRVEGRKYKAVGGYQGGRRPMSEHAVSIKTTNLTKIYTRGNEEVRSVNDVTIRIDKGDFVSIIGPSGSGKTTLVNLLGCLDNPTSGELHLAGRSIFGTGKRLSERELTKIRRETFGYIFQNFYLIPTLTVMENVLLPLTFYRKPGTEHEAAKLLKLLGMDHRKDHLPGQISGGEMQRVAIARAMVNRPEILLADEPTGNLDTKRSVEIVRVLKELNACEGLTIVMVTHNQDLAREANRMYEMRDGQISSLPV
jgi:ABC-type lipoprotein export system ATPase subunit/ABC-type lipoprotein release transport system permease subunit